MIEKAIDAAVTISGRWADAYEYQVTVGGLKPIVGLPVTFLCIAASICAVMYLVHRFKWN